MPDSKGRARTRLARIGVMGVCLLVPAGAASGQLDDWVSIKPTGTDILYGLHFPVDAVTGYVCGDNGVTWKTTDGGRNWTTLTLGESPVLTGVGFADDSIGVITADNGKVYRTIDGGSTWTPTVLAGGALNGIQFVTPRVAYAVGATGDIFKSVDAGANFVQQDTPVATTLQNVDFPVDATTGWISGAGGVVLKRTGQHMVTGVYTGTGVDDLKITGLGFQPNVVIVRADANKSSWIRTSSMAAGLSRNIGVFNASSKTDRIKSLDTDGFTLGTHNHVNTLDNLHYFHAWKAEAGVMTVGTYEGDEIDNRWINVGLQPAYIMVWENGAGVNDIQHRFSTQPTGRCFRSYYNLNPGFNRILDFDATGFQIGINWAALNEDGVFYNYIAWAEVAGKMKVGTYTGNGTDDRAFTGLGFRPEVVLIENEATTVGTYSVIRSEAIIDDFSQSVANDTDGNDADAIQRLDDDGFQVGTTQNIAGGGGPWYNASWAYRKKLTIDNTKVSAAGGPALTNFPVLISMTHTDLQAARADGFDILFTDDDALTKLDHEIEKWDDGTGELIAWVRVPSLPDTVDKDLYVYYGYASASDQQNVNGVWDANYKAVLHLGEAVTDEATSTNAHDDSTSNNNDGDQYNNGPAAGTIDMGQDFDGTADRVIIPDDDSLDATGNYLTVSAWIQPDFDNTSVDRVIADKWLSNQGWRLWFKDTTNDFRFEARIGNSNKNATTSGATWTVGTKLYIVGAYDGGRIRIYLNGVQESTSATGFLVASTEDLTIGIDAGSTDDPFDGDIDEVRISVGGVRRSAGWILTEYNNQSDPASFFTAGAEETSGAGDTYHWVAWGGKWNTQTTPTAVTLSDIDMFDESTGCAVGDSDTVLRTVDGGTNWTAESTGSGVNLMGVHMLSATVGYCCGNSGKIFKTTDGGVSWTEQTTETTNQLWAIQFPEDPTTGFATGVLSSLVRTKRPLVRTGMYTGDGVDSRSITGAGFRPNFVVIKGKSEFAVARTSTMVGDASKYLVDGASKELQPDWIQTLDSDGFTIGTGSRVNTSGNKYFWSAFKAQGELKVSTYAGDGLDDHSITGVGFEPDYLIVMPAEDEVATHRFAGMTGDASFPFFSSTSLTNRIQAFQPDGFQVGDDWIVNKSGSTYHYVAFKELPQQIDVGSYTGDGWDEQSIPGLGVKPELVILKSETLQHSFHRPHSMGGGDTAFDFDASSILTDHIRALESNGFQVGSEDGVNAIGVTYHWVAFGRDPSQPGMAPFMIRWVEVDPYAP